MTTPKKNSKGTKAFIDDLIIRLLSRGPDFQNIMLESEAIRLCKEAALVFSKQPSMVEIEPPVSICGDLHGQYHGEGPLFDLLRIFDRIGFPPLANYLFLGDYVDRGSQSIETISLLFCYKIRFPKNILLLRGNHECKAINNIYGFAKECRRRLGPNAWRAYQDVFDVMPLTGLIGGRILCMHGGLSPQLKSLEQLRSISRPLDPPNPSLHLDLLWADPSATDDKFEHNTRGCSYTFGADVVAEYCKMLDIDLIVRAHQVVQDGYEFFADRKLVTLFSAPHYCQQFDNAAAVLNVDANMGCSFTILRPVRMREKSEE